jgi:Tfp pilus assembly protein FimV
LPFRRGRINDISASIVDEGGAMRLSRRLTAVLLVLVVGGALAPSALAGKKSNPAPAPTPVVAPAPAPAPAPAVTPAPAPEPVRASMVDIEALR